ncbi:MAG: HNH endonuclease, partial [Opitutales bacterium]
GGTSWISDADPAHNFFRDYQTPWTLTGVLQPTIETKGEIHLTELGRMLAQGVVSQRAVMIQAMAMHKEDVNGEHPYAIIAAAYLKIGNHGLTLEQIYHCIAAAWRPGDGEIILLPKEKCPKIGDATKKRRLRSILTLMALYGCLSRNDGYWSRGDEQLLQATAYGAKYPLPTSLKKKDVSAPNVMKPQPGEDDLEEVFKNTGVAGTKSPFSKVLREIAVRRGQSAFRSQLLSLYGEVCAVTDWDSRVTLEAAHILPVSDDGSNDITNGILLRSDIHTLFDLNCLAIDPSTWKVKLSSLVRKTKYSELDGKEINLPASLADYPSENRLREHLLNLRD